MKLYTKTGDKGFTSLIGGRRVPKYHLRIESYGTVDELNSYIGLVRGQDITLHYTNVLKEVQDCLFVIGCSLATEPDAAQMSLPDLTLSDVELLEQEIDRMSLQLPELKHFILPGGTNAISFCHIARCICRRAERLCVHLSEESSINGLIIVYLNRLSDYLFTLARIIAKEKQIIENQWVV